jgi:PAS domain S-box-containing protein
VPKGSSRDMSTKQDYGLLSEREEQVLLLSTKGLTDKEIAKKLNLSIATVNTYWVRIRTKLGGANRAELVAAALHMNAEETLTAKEIENQRLISEIVRRAEAEKALRDSQEKLQSIIDGSPVIVFTKDELGRYTLVNKELEALVGRDRKDILGKRDVDIFPPEVVESFKEADARVIQQGETIEQEVRVNMGDGERVFLSVKFPLIDVDGSRYAICCFSRDITTRIEAQEERRRSEERFRALINNSTDLLTIIEPNGNIIYSSPSTERVLGFAPEEVVGTNVFSYIHRKDLRGILSSLESVLEAPGKIVVAEYRVKRKDGEWRYMEGMGNNLLHEESVGAIVLNYRDVTERKMAEQEQQRHTEELHTAMERLHMAEIAMQRQAISLVEARAEAEKERRRFQELFEGAPDGYIVTDLEARVQEANHAALEMLGMQRDQLRGMKFEDCVLEDDRSIFSSDLAEHVGNAGAKEWEIRIQPQGKPMFDASISVSVVHGEDGKAESLRWLLRDITRRKWAENELKVANEALERRARIRTIELEEANERLKEEMAERKLAEQDVLDSHSFAKSVIECSTDGILAFDRDFKYIVWNHRMEELTGMKRSDVLGKVAFDVFPFLGEIGEDDFMKRALRGERCSSEQRPFRVSQTDRNGFFEAHYSPLRSESGDTIGGLGIVREITERMVSAS